jgi:hypothetical protein
MAAGTYEPKQAFADWSFLMTLGWLSLVPTPPMASLSPTVQLRVHLGAKNAAGSVWLPTTPPSGSIVAGDLKLSAGAKKIPKNKIDCELFDQGSTLVVTVKGLDNQALGLNAGDLYSSEVTVGNVQIARIRLAVYP